jgi:hypothetical protein
LGVGDWAHAQRAFEEAVIFNPQGTLSRYRLEHSQRRRAIINEALQTLEAILRIDPSAATPWYDIGVVDEGMEDQEIKKKRTAIFSVQSGNGGSAEKDPKNVDTAFCRRIALSLGSERKRRHGLSA